MSHDGDKSGKDHELSDHEQEKHSQFNLDKLLSAENMALSQDFTKALPRPQMAEWMHFIENYEYKPGQKIEAFVETIENVASILGWGDPEKLICCKLKLKGEAQNVLRAYPQMKDTRIWEDFVAFLLAGCGTVADRPQCKAVIRARVIKENQTAMFLKGLRPSIQQFILSRSPKTFEKALQYAHEEAQTEQMPGGINYAQAVEDRGSQIRVGIRCPAENCTARDPKCFICGSTNHRKFANPVKCERCFRTGHSTSNCRPPEFHFCKRVGHSETTCFKKENSFRNHDKETQKK
ncbi:hypothetical protein PR048_020994 [Dryococelus australis]|uniref:Gag protein n=1 Tax=Dryococelus australis TaxID=614101 RepID=A0ABQ9GX08_9NEOP|nr:hypothetical protein PR048_020994 [Dryococelus australis]